MYTCSFCKSTTERCYSWCPKVDPSTLPTYRPREPKTYEVYKISIHLVDAIKLTWAERGKIPAIRLLRALDDELGLKQAKELAEKMHAGEYATYRLSQAWIEMPLW